MNGKEGNGIYELEGRDGYSHKLGRKGSVYI